MTTDDWIAKFIAGDWIPMKVIENDDALRLRLREFPVIYSVNNDAVKIKI